MKRTVEIEVHLPCMFRADVEVDLPETATDADFIAAAKAKWAANDVVVECDPMLNQMIAKYQEIGDDDVEFTVVDDEATGVMGGGTDVEFSVQ